MKIAIGTDHGGFALKQAVVDEVKKLGSAVLDCGAASYDAADDYPDFTRRGSSDSTRRLNEDCDLRQWRWSSDCCE
jgi:ribose 5-phosphate isomerase B